MDESKKKNTNPKIMIGIKTSGGPILVTFCPVVLMLILREKSILFQSLQFTENRIRHPTHKLIRSFLSRTESISYQNNVFIRVFFSFTALKNRRALSPVRGNLSSDFRCPFSLNCRCSMRGHTGQQYHL